MDQENEIPDWEMENEKVPPSLERKWEEEERSEEKAFICRSCGKPVRQKATLCVFCGESTGVRIGLFSHLRGFLTENIWGLIVFLAILSAVILLLVL